ncbi:MAG: thiamine phosphate synthase, partial [Burkholderiales bacterium]|nr:thiamine phosphate synthase [Burkholderiales bacterium]
GWRGEPEGREGQRFAWQRFPALTAAPILPANGPILKALALPLQMAVTCAERIGEALSLDRLDAALDRGLRLVQVREKGWSEDRLLRFARAVVERARRRDARVVLNGTADQAAACGADGVHLSAAALARIDGRPDLPLVGASCHTAGELMRVADLQLDYAVLGPVAATTSHPEASPIGWSAFSRLVSGQPMPVFAIGGLDPVDLPAARRAGAHGVAMIRGAFPDRP